MTALPNPVATDEAPPNIGAGLGAAIDVLISQRDLLARSGGIASASQAEAQLAELAPGLMSRSGMSNERAITALCIALQEIGRRQQVIVDRFPNEDTFERIALDALSSAMHRVRTSLDVALGLLEEIAEVCAGDDRNDVVASAREAAKSLRLVYHYSHELNEMAGLREGVDQVETVEFGCSTIVAGAIQDLSRLAEDCGVALNVDLGAVELMSWSNAAMVRRIVRQLLLLAIVSPGVTTVTCAAKQLKLPSGILTTFNITDNGRGMSLADRAAVTQLRSFSNEPKQTADLAGFAVARRMAQALGGKLVLEYLPGRGSRSQLTFPSRPPVNSATLARG